MVGCPAGPLLHLVPMSTSKGFEVKSPLTYGGEWRGCGGYGVGVGGGAEWVGCGGWGGGGVRCEGVV